MNQDSIETAQVMLGVFAEQLSPDYEALRRQLAGELACNGTQLEDMRRAEAARRTNHNLVTDFVNTLPVTTAGRYGTFLCSDAYEAKQVQANTLWLRTPRHYDDRYGSSDAYYIIGQSSERGEKRDETQLLLASADTDKKGLALASVYSNQFVAAQDIAQNTAFTDYNAQTLQNMFDPDTQMLCVSEHDAPLKTQLAASILIAPLFAQRRNLDKLVTTRGMSAKLDRVENHFGGRLDDAMLAEFDVSTSLNQLAVAFGREEALQQLFASYEERVQAELPRR